MKETDEFRLDQALKKEIFKKNKLFFKKGLTNEKTFAIIDKPTSGEHLE